jgi:hypothetical protein
MWSKKEKKNMTVSIKQSWLKSICIGSDSKRQVNVNLLRVKGESDLEKDNSGEVNSLDHGWANDQRKDTIKMLPTGEHKLGKTKSVRRRGLQNEKSKERNDTERCPGTIRLVHTVMTPQRMNPQEVPVDHLNAAPSR